MKRRLGELEYVLGTGQVAQTMLASSMRPFLLATMASSRILS